MEPQTPEHKWYVVHVQSGKEGRIRLALQKRIKESGMEAFFGEVLVPTERVSEVKGGKKSVRERKLYPGYVMVQMTMTDESWFLVRSTLGVGGFLGGSKPGSMATYEIERLLAATSATAEDKPKLKIDFKKGDTVRIKEGPFENFDGVVEEVIPAKGLVKLTITIFGRATPVELEYWLLERT